MDFETDQYNMTFTLFYRVNTLFYRGNSQAMNLDLYGWYHTILALYREIAPLIKKDNDKYETMITDLITPFQEISKSIIAKQPYTIDYTLYKKLMDFEIELRKVLKENKIYIQEPRDRGIGVS